MNTNSVYRLLIVIALFSVLLSSCNLPVYQGNQSGASKPTATRTSSLKATGQPSSTPTPTSTDTPLPTATETPFMTATSTPVTLATNTPFPTFTNTPYVSISKLHGTVTAVKARGGAFAIGGAGITLYDNGTAKKVTTTRTAYTGEYQFTQVAPGQYYLVVVWIFQNASSWPCSKDLLPDSGHKWDSGYKDGNMPISVELRSDSSGYVLVISTGAFSVGSGQKNVPINLICSQLK